MWWLCVSVPGAPPQGVAVSALPGNALLVTWQVRWGREEYLVERPWREGEAEWRGWGGGGGGNEVGGGGRGGSMDTLW